VPRTSSPSSQNTFYVLAGTLLVVAFLYWAQKVLIPVALAILLAFILTPAVSALQRRGLGRISSVLAVTVLVFLLLGGVGWIISQQLGGIIYRLPSYKDEVVHKIEGLRGVSENRLWTSLRDFTESVTRQLLDPDAAAQGDAADTGPPGTIPAHPVYVTTASSGWSRLLELAGPAGEGLASTFLVVVLTVFMLTQRETLRNRIVGLIGHGRLVVTTRALDEGARRISRYLLMQVFVNTTFGLLLAVGLFVLGLYADPVDRPALRTTAVFWGFVAGSLRFVPYLGTWLAAGLLFVFTVATLPGWTWPLVVFAYFMVLELLTANAVEPLLFGHSTGSSPLALLLAAAFWTWLWGPVGLVLSTPLTVILVVVGKYVPQLQFFEILLGDEPALTAPTIYYQRLVARDLDEASDRLDEYLVSHSLEEAYQDMLLPALIQGRHDRDRGELDADDLQYIYGATRNLLEDITPAPPAEAGKAVGEKVVLVGCPARDDADEVALGVFAALLRLLGHRVEVLSSRLLAAEVLSQIAEASPPVVCIASLPPGGLAQARYLCKRVRTHCPDVKIALARWGQQDNLEAVTKRLKASGADYVSTTLAETRNQVVPLLQVAVVACSPPERALANGR
jgi:predicted PurR-regulated permease PerM